MTWNSTWPIGTISVKDNRATGAENTAYIETTEKVDHFWNESAPNDGKHKKVTLPVQATQPATLANEVEFFSKNTTSGSVLCFARDGNADQTQFTTASITKPKTEKNGYTFLPSDGAVGGLLMQWGTKDNPGFNGTISFPTSFKAGTIPFSIQVSPFTGSDSGNAVVDRSTPLTNTSFDYYFTSNSPASKIFWLALGQAPD